MSTCWGCILLSLIAPLVVCQNIPPYLVSNRTIVVKGAPSRGSVQLKAQGFGTGLNWTLEVGPPSGVVNVTKLHNTGIIEFNGINHTRPQTIPLIITISDSKGVRRYTDVILDIRGGVGKPSIALALSEKEAGDVMRASRGLANWQFYLVVVGATSFVALITSLLVYNCCTFESTLYDEPIKRSNKIVDKPSNHEMNPFSKPKRMSLIVREAVRSGAADGIPYYGTRRSGVWIPQSQGDNAIQAQSVNLDSKESVDPATERKQSVRPTTSTVEDGPPSELPTRGSERRKSVGRRLSQDMGLFKQVPWDDISTPRHSFQS